MYRLKCKNCKEWGFYLQFLPQNLYHTIADTRLIKILPWGFKNKKIVGMPPFNYCGWCGHRLVMELIGVSKWDRIRVKIKKIFVRKNAKR